MFCLRKKAISFDRCQLFCQIRCMHTIRWNEWSDLPRWREEHSPSRRFYVAGEVRAQTEHWISPLDTRPLCRDRDRRPTGSSCARLPGAEQVAPSTDNSATGSHQAKLAKPGSAAQVYWHMELFLLTETITNQTKIIRKKYKKKSV